MVSHTCRCLYIATQDEQLQVRLATLPVTVELVSDGIRVFGLTPHLLGNISTDVGWTDAPLRACTHAECHCKFKTAVVPAGGPDLWAQAMTLAPHLAPLSYRMPGHTWEQRSQDLARQTRHAGGKPPHSTPFEQALGREHAPV